MNAQCQQVLDGRLRSIPSLFWICSIDSPHTQRTLHTFAHTQTQRKEKLKKNIINNLESRLNDAALYSNTQTQGPQHFRKKKKKKVSVATVCCSFFDLCCTSAPVCALLSKHSTETFHNLICGFPLLFIFFTFRGFVS